MTAIIFWMFVAMTLVVVVMMAYDTGRDRGWRSGFEDGCALTKRNQDALRNVEPIKLDVMRDWDRAILQALLELSDISQDTIH